MPVAGGGDPLGELPAAVVVLPAENTHTSHTQTHTEDNQRRGYRVLVSKCLFAELFDTSVNLNN